MTADKAFKIFNTLRLVALILFIATVVWLVNKPVDKSKNTDNTEVVEVVDTEQTSE